MSNYQRFRVVQKEAVTTEMETFQAPELQVDEVLVAIDYSGVNYKDALATQAKTGVVRHYPITPGIDLVGSILKSNAEKYRVGDEVLVTGFGTGVSHDGGFSQVQALPAEWLVSLPKNLTKQAAMIFGTAGFTAALAVNALEKHGLTEDSRVLVTGATGGVGNFAIHFLKQLGVKNITALSRKSQQKDYLTALGASACLQPEELFPEKTRPLDKQLFDFVIDTVGGSQMTKILPFIQYGGSVALCGNAGGIKLETTVLPFILRGVNLLGIDSVAVPLEQRPALWQKMADWQVPEKMQVNQTNLEDLPATIDALLSGQHVGRTIVVL